MALQTIFDPVHYASCLVAAEVFILQELGIPDIHEQAGKEVTDGSSEQSHQVGCTQAHQCSRDVI